MSLNLTKESFKNCAAKCLRIFAEIKIEHKRAVVIFLFGALAVTQVVLAAIGAFNYYSPVPRADSWYEIMRFFTKVLNHEVGIKELFAQHNEHRIFLSRILFFIDTKFFHGEGLYLLILNYVFVFFSISLFYRFIRETSVHNSIIETDKLNLRFVKTIIGFTVITLLFSRVQKENLDWEFQSQFFLVYLLPLLSFYLIYRAQIANKHSRSLFVLATFIGICSIGTMANGTFALPLMAVMSFIFRKRLNALLLVILSIAGFYIYFHGYHKPNDYASIGKVVLYYPEKSLFINVRDLVLYVLSYLGGAIHGLDRGTDISRIVGSFLIIGVTFPAWKYIKNPSKSPLQIALLTFIAYIFVTAFAIAGGRSVNGLDQAFASRYTTPTLMAWSALLILYIPYFAKLLNKNFAYFLPIILIPAIFIPKQLQAIEASENNYLRNHHFERKVVALALELGIKDKVQTDKGEMPGDPNFEIQVSRTAVENNLSVFNHRPIRNVNNSIGTKIEKEILEKTDVCAARISKIDKIAEDQSYLRIEGKMPAWVKVKTMYITNDHNVIVGYVLVNNGKKISLHDKKSQNNFFLEFKGYMLSNTATKSVNLIAIAPKSSLVRCQKI